ncbi:Uncharacterised protein [Candidatus Gugararchaeum adminiculabundum]|nr:Uncharacterised protein [Candidatus Gugararchaeum adminiculabundum]
MKIVEQTESIFATSDMAWGDLLIGIVAIAMGSIFIALSVLGLITGFTGLLSLIFGIIFVLDGLLALSKWTVNVARFDKGENKVWLSHKKILGSGNEAFTLKNISGVEVRQEIVGAKKGRDNYSYSLFLLFRDGTNARIDSSSGSSATGNASNTEISSEVIVGGALAKFLGVPLKKTVNRTEYPLPDFRR